MGPKKGGGGGKRGTATCVALWCESDTTVSDQAVERLRLTAT